MAIIDNKDRTMHQAIINALTTADRVDIEVAFFYFSGWQLLAKYLENKYVRILVGKYIDPNAVPDLLAEIKRQGKEVDLDPFQPRRSITSHTAKKQTYIDSFVRLSNESSLLDDGDNQDAFKILEEKVVNGTLEIKLTPTQEHGKMYIVHNRADANHNGDYPGTVFMGSSNFTFQGLLNQGELNERYADKERYEGYLRKFESLWINAENIDVATQDDPTDLIKQLKEKLWIHSVPTPYQVYVRVLHEIFGHEEKDLIKTPAQITSDQYSDLEYQIDAVRAALERLKKYDGVILADVVGLGKSIIASAIAHNLGMRSIIIAPPHLCEQWNDYQAEFKLPGAQIFSSGAVADVYEKYKNNNQPLLIIVDEAHRYKNEDNKDYHMLHHVCHSHKDNKVLLLTATPFNNDPKDVFALIKLFQVPGQSTIRSVDNLSLRFRELIERYKKLNNGRRSGKLTPSEINKEADEIALELRRLIENVVIRRSRLDLRTITRYAQDLKSQKIDFADVEGPILLEYELGDLGNLYYQTLDKLTAPENEGGFIGARYKPTIYIKNTEEFIKRYGQFLEEQDLKTAQTNLAKFMKRLLVMRFESSKDAFRSTLENMIQSTKLVESWWDTLGKVPIMKKGEIPDPETLLETTDDEIADDIAFQAAEEEISKLQESKGLVAVDKELLEESFIQKLRQDRELLEQIHSQWFAEDSIPGAEVDPKIDELEKKLNELLAENNQRKIVIFSTYADTTNYLYAELTRRGWNKLFKYTSADADKKTKQVIRQNFDAGLRTEDQRNDYDIIITTDALSEGYNLHRAGVIINYDIPYNPTRVIQRIGRINRINKKVFDKIYIYNSFPTQVGEDTVRIRQITTLKMRLINSIMGSDTRTITDDEEPQSFFKDEFEKVNELSDTESWDAAHRESYDSALKDKVLMSHVLSIPPRTRIIRSNANEPVVVAFGKKGTHSVFAMKSITDEKPNMVSTEQALALFSATENETATEADKQYDDVFAVVRDALFAKHPLPQIRGRRQSALDVVRTVELKLPKAKAYCRDLAQIIKEYDGINEGDLKRIAQLPIKDVESTYGEMQAIVSTHHIAAVNDRVSRMEGEYETIVLSEDLRL